METYARPLTPAARARETIMLRWLLKNIGYYRVDYGFSCGRHWLSIDGRTVAQTSGDHCYLPDEMVHEVVYYTIDQGKRWSNPRAYLPLFKDHTAPTHVERLMNVKQFLIGMRASAYAKHVEEAIHFIERESKMEPSDRGEKREEA